MARRRLSPRRLARWLEGRSSLARLLDLNDSDRDDLAWYAGRLVTSGAYDEAMRLFELLGRLWPEAEATMLLGHGGCLQLRGSLAEAERAYDAVLEAQPENAYALTNRAEVRLLTRRGAAARDDLAGALAALDRTTADPALRRRVLELREHARGQD
jgi:tetratricopeptide (TPR) repeat protein